VRLGQVGLVGKRLIARGKGEEDFGFIVGYYLYGVSQVSVCKCRNQLSLETISKLMLHPSTLQAA
jgi:hypothetical protein